MKTNIQKVKYNKNPNIPDKCDWYTWDEYCDNCSEHHYISGTFLSNKAPDIEEKDYCLSCLRNMVKGVQQ